jgi:hypothetical protein
MEASMTKLNYYAVLFTIGTSLAACSDSTIAPSAPQVADESIVQGSNQTLTGMAPITFSITIDPSRNTTFYLGAGNSLYFPAGSLCSLNSSYGVGNWDKPCTKATLPLTVNVKAWLNSAGKPRVDFDKHVRFVPTMNPAQFVVIQFADLQASLDPFFNILYCPATDSKCFDEAKTDLSLVTVRNPITGKVTRRIKHFSGYNVAAGEEEERGGGFFNLNSGLQGLSISVRDFGLTSVSDVRAAYSVDTDEATKFLERINSARKLSGYILASGHTDME